MNISYAGLWLRVKAFAADYLIISAYILLMVGLSLAAQSAFPMVLKDLFSSPLKGQLTGFLVMTLPVTLYFALLESSSRQATIGKRWQRLKVTSQDNMKLSLPRALARTAVKFIPWELAHACIWQSQFNYDDNIIIITSGIILVWVLVGIYLVTILFTSKKQALYDQLANTYVIRAEMQDA